MQVTGVKIKVQENLEQYPNYLARATVILNDSIAVHGIHILKNTNTNEYWVSMAARKESNGNFREYYHPIHNDFRNELTNKLLGAYQEVLKNPENNTFHYEDEVKPITITKTQAVLLHNTSMNSSVKASIYMILDNCFILNQMQIIKRKDNQELFLAMPRRKLINGDYFDIYHPINQENRKLLIDAAFKAYHAACQGNV